LAIAATFVLVAFISFVLYPCSAARTHGHWVIIISSLAMFALGFWDDLSPVGAKRKLLGQILISSMVFFGGIHIGTFRNPLTDMAYALGPWGSWLATVFWLVAFTNLINLIDGVDGLAAGVSMIVMILMLYVGIQSHLVLPVVCAAGLVGALLGFLCYNFPPASIYLGDGGAYFLGFLIGLLSMVYSQKGTVVAALIAPLFVLALPIIDVALAISRRGLKGVPIFRPDKQHLHHRLAAIGYSRTLIVLVFYAFSALFLLLALGIFVSKGRWLPLAFGVASTVLLFAARCFPFSREWFALGRVLANSLEVRKQARYTLTLSRWIELDAERCRSAEELWADFIFAGRKLGFCAVTLVTPEGAQHWGGAPLPDQNGHPLRSKRNDLPEGCGISLEVTGPSNLDVETFELLSDLYIETWVKAVQCWKKSKRVPFSFRFTRPAISALARPLAKVEQASTV